MFYTTINFEISFEDEASNTLETLVSIDGLELSEFFDPENDTFRFLRHVEKEAVREFGIDKSVFIDSNIVGEDEINLFVVFNDYHEFNKFTNTMHSEGN